MKDTNSDTEWLTPSKEAAKLFRVHVSTVYQWLSTTFLPLAQKHHLDEEEAKQFLSELLTSISSKKYDVHRSFNQTLEGVRHAFEQLVESKTVDEFQTHLSIFALEIETLSLKLDGQPE